MNELQKRFAKYSALFLALSFLLFVLTEVFAVASGGYTFEFNEQEEELYVNNTFTGGEGPYPVNDDTIGHAILLMSNKVMLDDDWLISSFVNALLIIGFIAIFRTEIRIIKNRKIYVPLFTAILVGAVIFQVIHYSSGVQEIQTLINELRSTT